MFTIFTGIQKYGTNYNSHLMVSMPENKDKVKTTVLLDKTLKKLSQIYAIQNDMSLQELIEKSLKEEVMKSTEVKVKEEK